jgi:hypothetical protein
VPYLEHHLSLWHPDELARLQAVVDAGGDPTAIGWPEDAPVQVLSAEFPEHLNLMGERQELGGLGWSVYRRGPHPKAGEDWTLVYMRHFRRGFP